MLRHLRNQHANLVCDDCDRIFYGSSAFQKHVRQVHSDAAEVFKCSICDKAFGRNDNCERHEQTCNKKTPVSGKKRPAEPVTVYRDFNVRQLRNAFGGVAQTWRLGFPEATDDIVLQLKDGVLKMENALSGFRYARIALKFTMAIHAVFEKSIELRTNFTYKALEEGCAIPHSTTK